MSNNALKMGLFLGVLAWAIAVLVWLASGPCSEIIIDGVRCENCTGHRHPAVVCDHARGQK